MKPVGGYVVTGPTDLHRALFEKTMQMAGLYFPIGSKRKDAHHCIVSLPYETPRFTTFVRKAHAITPKPGQKTATLESIWPLITKGRPPGTGLRFVQTENHHKTTEAG